MRVTGRILATCEIRHGAPAGACMLLRVGAMQTSRFVLLLAVAVVGCASDVPGDGPDDDFLVDGKADDQIAEGSPEAKGILAVVNELSEEALDDAVGLDLRAAANIFAHRAGVDGLELTADDDPFDTLAELDAIPYVGPLAFNKLLAFARGNGYVLEGPNYNAIWSIAADDAWAVGDAGLVERWDGAAWARIPSGVTASLLDVWASGPNDVWIVGRAGTALHWDGAALTPVALPADPDEDLQAVSGSGPDQVWIVGGRGEWQRLAVRWDGVRFEEIEYGCPTLPTAVHVVSATEVWAGGLQETVCRFDGVQWQNVSPYLPSYPVAVSDIWRAPSGTVYIILGGDVWQRTADQWSKMFSVPVEDGESWNDLHSLAAFAENDLWVTGANGHVAHWDGAAWQVTHVPGRADYLDIAGSSSTDLWTLGFGARAHFDGMTWTESLGQP